MLSDSISTFIYLSAGTENIRGGLNRMIKVLKAEPKIILHSELTPGAIHQNNAIFSSASAVAKCAAFYRSKPGM
jgi:hypothetical protein